MTGLKKIGYSIFFVAVITSLLYFIAAPESKMTDSSIAKTSGSENAASRETTPLPEQNGNNTQRETSSASASEAAVEDADIPDKTVADQIMAFNNHAMAKLQSDWRNPAEMFYNLGHIYLRIFQIPAKLDLPARKRQDLLPPAGLFGEKEEAALFLAMDNMDKALASSLTHFGQLKNYILDATIQDNGRNGRKIVGMLEQDYKAFRKAHKAWLEIVERKVDAAEKSLLKGHPLQRQAIAASSIMRTINAVAMQIQGDDVDRKSLSRDALKINALIASGEKPPFPAHPSLERFYRIFLHNASVYADTLGRGALEGLYDIQKRELSLAGRACSESYNDFVTAFNDTLNTRGPKSAIK